MASQRRVAVQMGINHAYKRHTSVFAGIHDFARQHDNWRLIIDEWADHTLPTRAGDPLPYDGLVGRISALGARRARRLGLPVVNVWFNSPARRLPGVFPDFVACGRLSAEHLLARGFRNFGAVFRSSFRASEVQADAFEGAVRKAGCKDFHKLAIESESDALDDPEGGTHRDWQRNVRAIERWIDTLRTPVGLYIYDIGTARVIIESCLNRGWRVPEDIAVVAGMNEEAICERPEPSLTSLELPYEQIGFEAAQLLDRLMGKKEKGVAPDENLEPILLPPVGIVARRSTDFQAVDDPLVRRVLRLIDENLHRRLSIDELAEEAGVSRRTLTTRFRDHLRRSVADEIQRLRVERVKRELTASDQTVREIALQVGFGSPRTLNDAFKSELGCTPREYRKQWPPARRKGARA